MLCIYLLSFKIAFIFLFKLYLYCIQKACIESPLSIVSSSSGCGTSITNISCGTGSVELDLPRVHATYHSFHQPWELESSKQLYCQTDIVPIKVYIYFKNYILLSSCLVAFINFWAFVNLLSPSDLLRIRIGHSNFRNR